MREHKVQREQAGLDRKQKESLENLLSEKYYKSSQQEYKLKV